ncbi:hypothetical protein JKP88DRAFT_330470 [Tribonema minus]|uniref:Uncharacterized protein n=1 Tax=Tribonema minus TaxID=303371 RepID=A0A835YNM0_9STRA|nr:hypothetical protein JKP88DRAFT_330470 [Tribonema minus]
MLRTLPQPLAARNGASAPLAAASPRIAERRSALTLRRRVLRCARRRRHWPLTTAPALRCGGAMDTVLWLDWDAPLRLTTGKPVPTGACVTYRVYMRGGWRNWCKGDAVRVLKREGVHGGVRAPLLQRGVSQGSVLSGDDSADENAFVADDDSLGGGGSTIAGSGGGGGSTVCGSGTSAVTAAGMAARDGGSAEAARILRVRKGGRYDVHYDAGGTEAAVARRRLLCAAAEPWSVIYVGEQRAYCVECIVPQAVLERYAKAARRRGGSSGGSGELRVAAEFALQVRGCELPQERWSLHGAAVTFITGGCGGSAQRQQLSKVRQRLSEAQEIDEAFAKCAPRLGALGF